MEVSYRLGLQWPAISLGLTRAFGAGLLLLLTACGGTLTEQTESVRTDASADIGSIAKDAGTGNAAKPGDPVPCVREQCAPGQLCVTQAFAASRESPISWRCAELGDGGAYPTSCREAERFCRVGCLAVVGPNVICDVE